MNNQNHRTTSTGRFGEVAAAEYLTQKGYRILVMNYRASHLEIDIIAEDDKRILFVEVKARTENIRNQKRFGRPARAVTKKKQQFIVSAARQYLKENDVKKQPRLDVIEVYFKSRIRQAAGFENTKTKEQTAAQISLCSPEISKINHIENAFGAR